MKLGKSQARAQFLPLVEQVAAGGGPVEITDRGKVAAVLLGHDDYLQLLARAGAPLTQTRSAVGCLEILGDLEQGSREIGRRMRESLIRTAEEL